VQPQLAKAASSAAANYRAAQRARSRVEFISKLSVALEEIDETAFWLDFLPNAQLIAPEGVAELLREKLTDLRRLWSPRAKPLGSTESRPAERLPLVLAGSRSFSPVLARFLALGEIVRFN
jgi:four helix bundle protein